ncbi:MAG: hypothetical protein ACLP9L_11165 [Thermoguttaceae bacterium]
MVCASPSPAPRRRWHRQFLALLPQIVTHAKIAFRHLKPEARAEMVEEVVCNAMQAFVRLVQLKKTDIAYAAPLAAYGCKQARDGRKVGGHLNCLDVSSDYCQRLKGIVVERLDRRDPDDDKSWQEVLVEDRRSDASQIVQTKLDFSDWLASLKRRDRRIAEFLAQGETTKAAARKFKVSAGRISQLRKGLYASWNRFVGDEPDGAALAA